MGRKKSINKNNTEESIFKLLMVFATIAIFSIILFIVIDIFLKGFSALSLKMITENASNTYSENSSGGIFNSILGSLILSVLSTIIATIISLPIVFYLNVYIDQRSKFAKIIRLSLDILWGIPSIVYGSIAFIIMIFLGIKASLLGGIITLSLLVIPILTRYLDEITKILPHEFKENAFISGITKSEYCFKILFRQIFPGFVSAVILSFGRVIGDSAAILFTTGYSNTANYSLFEPIATLPLTILFEYNSPFQHSQDRAYAAACVLIIIVLIISFSVRFINNKYQKYLIK